MASSKLRRTLERDAGSLRFHWILPHPLLPPRYRKHAQGRNLVLLLDQDFTLHLLWEGSRLNEPSPLTPRAAVRLLKEVNKNITKYRKELNTFAKFVGVAGEHPQEGILAPEPEPATASKGAGEVKVEALLVQRREMGGLPAGERGGESPMGGLEEVFGE